MNPWLHDCGDFLGGEDAPYLLLPPPFFHSFSFAARALVGCLLATVSTADGSKQLLHFANLGQQLISKPGGMEALVIRFVFTNSYAASTFMPFSVMKHLISQKHSKLEAGGREKCLGLAVQTELDLSLR